MCGARWLASCLLVLGCVCVITPPCTALRVVSTVTSQHEGHGAHHRGAGFKAALTALKSANPNAGLAIMEINTRATPTFPFVLCHDCACDICSQISNAGVFAPVETSIMARYILTQEACADGVVVDVGANVGYFAMLAAAAGCKVHAFEPNSGPRMLLKLNVMINDVHSLVKVHGVAISAERSTGTMAAGNGLWGYGSVQAAGDAATSAGETFDMRPVTDFVQRDVLMLKVDTEGFEASVFEGAWGLLQSHKVHNVVVEVKDFNSQAKRKLLNRIMLMGQFKHVYNYNEAYGQRIDVLEGSNLATLVFDVTEAVRDNLETHFRSEDFWFRMEPLGPGHFTPN